MAGESFSDQTDQSGWTEGSSQSVDQTAPAADPSNSQTDQQSAPGLDPGFPSQATSGSGSETNENNQNQPDQDAAPAAGDKQNEPDPSQPGSNEDLPDSSQLGEGEENRPIELKFDDGSIVVVAKTTSNILPEGTGMGVRIINESNEPEYLQVKEALNNSQIHCDGLLTLDISFIKDGQKITPSNGTVAIEASIKKDDRFKEAIPESLQLHQIITQAPANEGEKEVFTAKQLASYQDETVTVNDDSVQTHFEADSSSLFALAWNTEKKNDSSEDSSKPNDEDSNKDDENKDDWLDSGFTFPSFDLDSIFDTINGLLNPSIKDNEDLNGNFSDTNLADESETDQSKTEEEKPSVDDEDKEEGKKEDEETPQPVEFTAKYGSIEVVAKTTSDILPKDAVLTVQEIPESDEDGSDYQQAKAALEEKNIQYDGLLALDISFYKDGNEIEPENGTVTIEATVKEPDVLKNAEPESLEVHHINEQGSVEAQKVASSVEGEIKLVSDESLKMVFDVTSFSTFTITWTSDSYSRYTFTINAECLNQNGNSIDINDSAKKSINGNRTYMVSDLAPASAGNFIFDHALYEGKEIDKLRVNNNQLFLISNDHTIATLSCSDWQSKEVSLTFVYRSVEPGIYFNENGGSQIPDPQFIEYGSATSEIELPDYKGSREGYVFCGWSEEINHLQQGGFPDCYHPGEKYKVTNQDESITFYAIWSPKSYKQAAFYLKTDGQIPSEPVNTNAKPYTPGIIVQNAIKHDHWMKDTDRGKVFEYDVESDIYYSQNKISNNLNAFPSLNQIKQLYPNFNPKTHYIHWYAQKYSGTSRIYTTNTYGSYIDENGRHYNVDNTPMWHIDGVILQRNLVSVAYEKNCGGETLLVEVPQGYEVNKETEIVVGAAKGSNQAIAPQREGYDFVGWSLISGEAEPIYQGGDKYTVNENVTFYAQWRKKMIVPSGLNDLNNHLPGFVFAAGAGLLLLGAFITLRRRINEG